MSIKSNNDDISSDAGVNDKKEYETEDIQSGRCSAFVVVSGAGKVR